MFLIKNYVLSTQIFFLKIQKKVQVGNDQEKAQSEINSHSKNRGGKTNLYLENIS